MLELSKYSIGTGDRFGMQAEAQLKAVMDTSLVGSSIDIVWNKSWREHTLTGSQPYEVRHAADAAVANLGWEGKYFVDADHITVETVEHFIECSDFFTIDVASSIGGVTERNDVEQFIRRNKKYVGRRLDFSDTRQTVSGEFLLEIASQYLPAVKQAAAVYSYIEERKGRGNFITEISMDEVTKAQSPEELFFILEALSYDMIPVGTIAPKFSGRFNKGVDYRGNPDGFETEFEADLSVIDLARKNFGLPQSLKLSLHSGSDKFSIYPVINKLIRRHQTGIHLKTAGTTWLEELIGLSLSGHGALDFVKTLYKSAYNNLDSLCAPYSELIDINEANLPDPDKVIGWKGEMLADSIIHNAGNRLYNRDMRQLLHIAYKLAADRLPEYRNHILENKDLVEKCVYNNLFDRHIQQVFG